MPKRIFKKPGIYSVELNAFPQSIAQVATAIPAFIGYTPKASHKGNSFYNKPTLVTSFQEYEAFFCLPDLPPPADPAKQYAPDYYLVESASQPSSGRHLQIEGKYYSILPDPNTLYYLYNCVRMFYENGGGNAYIVSVGGYGAPSGVPAALGQHWINPNVKLSELQTGLALLRNEPDPTLYVCPEATLLSSGENATLMQSMLQQNENMGTAVSLFDIIGAKDPNPTTFMDDIRAFRNNTGSQGLKYGIAYYPFVATTTMPAEELDYSNLFGGEANKLKPLINPDSNPNPTAQKILDTIEKEADARTVRQYDQALAGASKTYAAIKKTLLDEVNVLPPSGAMAGVYTRTDNERGVWKAPANVSIVGVTDLPIQLSDSQQADLNIDAVTGKSVNAIRFVNGQGILVWGARTLDGNSGNWKYVPTRRTITMIKQSVKMGVRGYAFETNDSKTWVSVKSMIESFLTNLWQQGAFQGSKPSEAFQVQCGLGSTMTSQDLLNGIMKIVVAVALIRPAEFIVISIQQEMAKP